MTSIQAKHLSRCAVVYLRQSSMTQVRNNLESQRLQYGLADRAKALGFGHVEVIDADLGISGGSANGGRPGFEHLVSLVALDQVGIVLSREVSRLSRNDSDWCRLLDICRAFGTLIGDDDHVYDPAELDDQLILGIKGTLSVVELGVLKLRMQQGKEISAAQGRLRCRLPSGYVYNLDGHPVKDPDHRTRELVDLAFRKFRELQNGRQLFMWFHDENIEMPVKQYVGGKMRVRWRRPTNLFLTGIIKNPFYAGTYVYGRRPVETAVRDGNLIKRVGKLRPAEESRVFIRDHHEAYVTWEEFEENVAILKKNAPRKQTSDALTSARNGAGLLVGLLRCGHCGRKLHVNYWGRTGTSPRYVCKGAHADAGDGCMGFAGTLVEKALLEQVLEVVSPWGIDASLVARDRLCDAAKDKSSVLSRRAQQLRYEANRAFEQYDEADPKNRLVAAELERRWNDRLADAEEAESAFTAATAQNAELDAPSLERLAYLGNNFVEAWESPDCPNDVKKKIIRLLIEEIVVNRNESELCFIVHWAGGIHTKIHFDRPAPGSQAKTSADAMDTIRVLATRYDDSVIAGVLNRNGQTTGRGNKWNSARVISARRRHNIKPILQSPESLGLLSLQKAVAYCGVSHATIHKLIRAGLVRNEQTIPSAPLEIRQDDIDSPSVQSLLRNLKETGKLRLKGDAATSQTNLFQQNQGDDNARYCK